MLRLITPRVLHTGWALLWRNLSPGTESERRRRPRTPRRYGQRSGPERSQFPARTEASATLPAWWRRIPEEVLASAGSLAVRLARTADEIAEAQRLRYQIFYEEMAATPTPEMAASRSDFDSFDEICDCLLLIDQARPKGCRVVGTYRLLRQDVAERRGGFYSAEEYDLSPLLNVLDDGCRGLELGRSCVHAEYRTKNAIQLLWRGIARYSIRYRIGFMFGCASLPGTDPETLSRELSYLHHFHLAPPELRVRALAHRYVAMDRMAKADLSPRRALFALPPLIKGYLRLGAYIGDGAVVDHQFGTTDVFIILPVANITERYFSHYELDRVAERQRATG